MKEKPADEKAWERIEGRCNAKRYGGRGLCHQLAGNGTSHPGIGRCKLHGGSTPSHVKAAEVVIAKSAVETYGLPRNIGPAEALLEEVQRTAGAIAWIEYEIRKLETDEVVYSKSSSVTGDHGSSIRWDSVPNVWVKLYQSERKHLVEVCKTALAAGIAERQVKLAERMGHLLAQAVTGALIEYGIELAKHPDLGPLIRKHLAAAQAVVENDGRGKEELAPLPR